MIEDELRATFARHEGLTPSVAPLRAAINEIAVRRRRRRRTVTVAAAAALVLLAGVSFPALVRALTPPSPVVNDNLLMGNPGPSSPVPDGPLNFLLLGLDRRSPGAADVRADTVMILHVPGDRSQAFLISIPRDARVPIPGHGTDKLAASFFHGSYRAGGEPDLRRGAQLTARTVQALTGTTFDGTALVEFSALRRVTDAIGGVRMCLDQEVTSWHTNRVFPKGCQELNGAAATDLLRQRYGLPGGTFDRDRMAQKYLKALLARATAAGVRDDPLRLHELLMAAGRGLTVDTGGLALPQLVSAVRGIEPHRVTGVSLESNVSSGGYVELGEALMATLFDALRRDELSAWAASHPQQLMR